MNKKELIWWGVELQKKIYRLKNCELQLAIKFYPGMYVLKIQTMAEISELNRMIYSK